MKQLQKFHDSNFGFVVFGLLYLGLFLLFASLAVTNFDKPWQSGIAVILCGISAGRFRKLINNFGFGARKLR